MKKIEMFRCEICGTQYSTEKECVRCEQAHKSVVRLVDAMYGPVDKNDSTSYYPTYISVQFADGAEVTYRKWGINGKLCRCN